MFVLCLVSGSHMQTSLVVLFSNKQTELELENFTISARKKFRNETISLNNPILNLLTVF